MYQHRRSLARRSSGTMAQLSARLVVRPVTVVRLEVCERLLRRHGPSGRLAADSRMLAGSRRPDVGRPLGSRWPNIGRHETSWALLPAGSRRPDVATRPPRAHISLDVSERLVLWITLPTRGPGNGPLAILTQ
jgi:hypothetical protein